MASNIGTSLIVILETQIQSSLAAVISLVIYKESSSAGLSVFNSTNVLGSTIIGSC
jgi:folate-dependent phosphoribosylglycinamide formyltransferase PurN